MRVYIMTDIEGTSGIVDFENIEVETITNQAASERMRRLQTAEVKAAIEGALEAGATEILVNDSHGSGRNLFIEEFPEEVSVIQGDLRYVEFWMSRFDDRFDAMLFTGGHAMEGTQKAVLPHTIWEVNGIKLGEVGMAMALAGHFNVPSVFVSGDVATMEEARALVPEIEVVATKEALSPVAAVNYSPEKVRRLIREGARRGLERRREIKPYFIEGPYEVRLGDDERVWNGDDLRDVVYEALVGTYYHYGKRLRREGAEWVVE